jgi:Rrf2 family protein
MRLTRAGEYAVRCVLYLSAKGAGTLISRKEIAEHCDIPDKFLAKIAQQLARVKLIEIRQGAYGGYLLCKEPRNISLLEVVEAIIGEISLNDCVTSSAVCRASASCAVNRVWIKVRNQLRDTLKGVTFAELLNEDSCFLAPPVSAPLDFRHRPKR